MAERIIFNKTNLNKVRATDISRRIYDTRTPGLCARVSPKGLITFILYRKSGGRVEQVTLGRFPEMPPELARRRVETLNGEIASGVSPSRRRRERLDEETFGELFARYLEEHAKPHKKSWPQDVAIFNRHLIPWAGRALSGIDQSTVRRLHARIGKNSGKYEANRMLSLVSGVFGRAVAWGWNGENPALHVTAFREKSRERFLSAEELPRLFRALREEPSHTIRDFLLVCLLTGARRGNVMGMRWEQIDFGSAVWRIPDTKAGVPQTVPLVAEAITLLRDREPYVVDGWVFATHSATGHLRQPHTAWRRICNRAGITDLRIHDLRRTLGSWQAGTGASLQVIGKSLGHKNLQTTQIYARLDLDPVRAAMERATQAMLATDK